MKLKLNTENIVSVILFISLFLYPFLSSDYGILNMSNFLTMIFLTLSLSIIWGYTGIFSSGQSVFFGIGGYVYGIFFLNVGDPAVTPLALIGGVVVAAIIAWILGYFMFYGGINDMFVALIMLCVTLAAETFMAQTAGPEWKIGTVPLGGYNGVNGISPLSVGFGESIITFDGTKFYYLVFFILLVIYFFLRKLVVSKWGFALIAVRENSERSQMFGYNVPKIQTIIFTLGGALGSLSGILYAAWGGYMVPTTMSLASATLPLILVAAGGRKNLTAAMLFSLIYSIFSQYLSANGNEYALIILGFILLTVMLFLPEGIIVAFFNLCDRLIQSRFNSSIKVVEVEKRGKNASEI
jgi:ABC-type branched-subunit amino acid transport system permease subunit